MHEVLFINENIYIIILVSILTAIFLFYVSSVQYVERIERDGGTKGDIARGNKGGHSAY
jgi:hypothetical protein